MRDAGHWDSRLATVLVVAVLATAPVGLSAARATSSKPTAPTKPTHTPASKAHLTNSAPSVDALVGRLIEALEHKDKAKLQGLRVTEAEYLDIIMPGSVAPGSPLREYDHRGQASQYFWRILDTKSIYSEANILNDFGGQPLKLKAVKYQRGIRDYATYRAYKQLRLVVERSDGKEDELHIGSIAEVNGQYKFISFIHD